MPFTLYDGSITIGLQALDSLKNILQKAQASANASSLPEARIHPDMLDLSFQVHISTDTISKLYARTTGTEPVQLDRNMKTFDEFLARIEQVRAIVQKADKALVNSRADEIVGIGMGPKTVEMPVSAYVTGYVLPNVFFHITTAYNICRKNDVQLGKTDYLAPFMGDYMPK